MKRRVLASSISLLACAAAHAQGVVTVYPDRDASMYAESGALANGAGQYLFTGMNSAGFPRRALLHFDVAGAIPPGSQVTHAELVLHLSNQSSGAEIVSIHGLTMGWGEGPTDPPGAEGAGAAAANGDATWTDAFFGQSIPWSSPGGDLGAVLASRVVDGIADWSFSSPTLTAAVDGMAQVPFYNDGICVTANETVASTAKRFESRESPTPAFRPRLLVTYSTGCTAPIIACFGATNSTGGRATLDTVGAPSVFTNDLSFRVTSAPPGTNGTFFFGTALTSVPFGDGTRCAGGTMFRFGTVSTDASGSATRTLDFSTPPGSTLVAGEQRWFQFAYHDLAAGGAGFNASDTLRVTFCP